MIGGLRVASSTSPIRDSRFMIHESCDLSFDGGEQVVDVIPFEQNVRSASSVRRFCRRAPHHAPRPTARSVPGAAPRVRRACDRSVAAPHPVVSATSRIGAGLARFANPIELLVERKHFLEKRWRHLRRAFLRRRRWQPFDRQQVLDAGGRITQRRDTRRSDTTTARGWRVALAAARCSSSRDGTCD